MSQSKLTAQHKDFDDIPEGFVFSYNSFMKLQNQRPQILHKKSTMMQRVTRNNHHRFLLSTCILQVVWNTGTICLI